MLRKKLTKLCTHVKWNSVEKHSSSITQLSYIWLANIPFLKGDTEALFSLNSPSPNHLPTSRAFTMLFIFHDLAKKKKQKTMCTFVKMCFHKEQCSFQCFTAASKTCVFIVVIMSFRYPNSIHISYVSTTWSTVDYYKAQPGVHIRTCYSFVIGFQFVPTFYGLLYSIWKTYEKLFAVLIIK